MLTVYYKMCQVPLGWRLHVKQKLVVLLCVRSINFVFETDANIEGLGASDAAGWTPRFNRIH